MRKLLLLFGLLLPMPAHAGGEWAVLRITSHGCSGTVIYADAQRSLVLSCAHMFLNEGDRIDPNLLARSFTFDAPNPNPQSAQRPGIKLLKYDVKADLCLIQINTRLPYVCPVAQVNCPGAAWSVGYDHMVWPAVVRPATRLGLDSFGRQLTRERPRAGRSGGPILGCNGTCVVGVCTGYTGAPNEQEVWPGATGIYVSHQTILKFLGWPVVAAQEPGIMQPTRPWVSEGVCPGGICRPSGH